VSHTYSIGSASSFGQASSHSPATRRAAAVKRPYRTIVLSLMLVTSSIAVVDLYLFASSGFH
jgi:hypothetical protein